MRLHGETEPAARERYRHYLQVALKCVHPTAYFFMAKRPLPGKADWALQTSLAPMPLKVEDGNTLYLTATQSFRMRQHKREWTVSTEEYIYNVAEREDTRDYMFAWHWHPNQRPECHMHVDAKLSNGMTLSRRHLPTARISFEEVLLFLIEECAVIPADPGWRKVLEDNQQRHERYRTWWGSRKRI